MSNPTTDQMNLTIAEFMNNDLFKKWMAQGDLPVHKLEYHSSWNWLMPVVEKISKIKLLNHDNTECTDPRDVCHPTTFAMPSEDGTKLMFRFKGFGLCMADTLIEAVHQACYEVALYHNQQNTANGK